jgi:cell wall-active antibiotic response 4TMS protein YvqF
VLLIGIGVFLLLQNAGVIDEDVRIWPIVVIVIALAILGERIGHPWWFGGGLFLPLVLLAVGGVALLKDLNVIDRDFTIWPVILIALGVSILWHAGPWGRRTGTVERSGRSIPLDGATSATITIEHGAGELSVGPLEKAATLLEGTFAGDIDAQVRREGDRLEVRLRSARGRGWPVGFRRDWTVWLNRTVPLSLSVRGGANQGTLDLRDLMVTEVDVQTGASQMGVVLPAISGCRVRIRGGAASVRVEVPLGVSLSIRARGGLGSFDVDTVRFPRVDGEYRSPGYETAEVRSEIDVEMGAGSVKIS